MVLRHVLSSVRPSYSYSSIRRSVGVYCSVSSDGSTWHVQADVSETGLQRGTAFVLYVTYVVLLGWSN
jgi:hypothetical protein